MPAPITYAFPAPDTQRLFLLQGSAPAVSWTWTDGTGAAIPLVGKTVKFTAYTFDGVTAIGVFQYTASISTNVATVQFAAGDTATARVLRYELLDMTDNVPICNGTVEIAVGRSLVP